MPTVAIRGMPAELKSEIQAFGRARELSVRDAAVELIRLGLQATAARAKGGQTAQAKLTDAERSTRGRDAAAARWKGMERCGGCGDWTQDVCCKGGGKAYCAKCCPYCIPVVGTNHREGL